jgi:glutathione S-transferase
MLLYTGPDPLPNPRRVRLFLAAKGLALPERHIDLLKGEHKAPAITALNPRAQIPFLQLDDGRVIAETISICRYLDELHPTPPMFGETAFERAETDMWIRRVETLIGQPVGLAWQHGHPFTAALVQQIPAMADQARARVTEAQHWLDSQLEGRQWLADARPSMADITLLTILDFARWMGLAMAGDHLAAWYARATERFLPPSPA